jgi:hypothetical protein
MEQSSSIVAVKIAQTLQSMEECALDMEQKSNFAAMTDAQIMPE